MNSLGWPATLFHSPAWSWHKKPKFSCRYMGNECIPSQILVTSVMVSECCDYCPPNPLTGCTDDKLLATACAVYCCEMMNGWKCEVIWIIQKALMNFSMLASWSQLPITFTSCKETGLIYKRNKQFSESYIVHWPTDRGGCLTAMLQEWRLHYSTLLWQHQSWQTWTVCCLAF